MGNAAAKAATTSDPLSTFRTLDPDALLAAARQTPAELVRTAPEIGEALNAVARSSVARQLTARLTAKSSGLARVLSRMDVSAMLQRPEQAKADLLARLQQAKAGQAALTAAKQRLAGLDLAKEMDAIVQPAQPIAANPLLAPILDGARLHRLGRDAGVPVATMDRARARGLSATALSARSLAEAVGDGALSAADAGRVACAVGLFRLADEDPDLTAALLRSASPGDPTVTVQSVQELAHWTATDWEQLLA